MLWWRVYLSGPIHAWCSRVRHRQDTVEHCCSKGGTAPTAPYNSFDTMAEVHCKSTSEKQEERLNEALEAKSGNEKKVRQRTISNGD